MPIDRKLLVSAEGKLLIGANNQLADKDCCCGDCIPGSGLPNPMFKVFDYSYTASGLGLEFNTFSDIATYRADNPSTDIGEFQRDETDDPLFFNDGAVGSWCRASLFQGSLVTANGDPDNVDCDNFCKTASVYTEIRIRYGIVNGQQGWHLLLYALTSGECLDDECELYYFDELLAESLVEGALYTVTRACGPLTITWTLRVRTPALNPAPLCPPNNSTFNVTFSGIQSSGESDDDNCIKCSLFSNAGSGTLPDAAPFNNSFSLDGSGLGIWSTTLTALIKWFRNEFCFDDGPYCAADDLTTEEIAVTGQSPLCNTILPICTDGDSDTVLGNPICDGGPPGGTPDCDDGGDISCDDDDCSPYCGPLDITRTFSIAATCFNGTVTLEIKMLVDDEGGTATGEQVFSGSARIQPISPTQYTATILNELSACHPPCGATSDWLAFGGQALVILTLA